MTESASTANGAYTFNPGFVLSPNTTYYLYENAAIPTSGGNVVAGEHAYVTSSSTSGFASQSAAANFTVSGIKVGVPIPEPSTIALSLTSVLVGLGLAARGRRIRA